MLYIRKYCILIILTFLTSPINVYSSVNVSAEYACVIEALTGDIVYEKNAQVKYPMASTTKIMTALVAIEENSLNDIVTVSRNAATQEGSSIYLRAGDQIAMRDLLYGLMLNSGNDAAVAVAEHISGDVDTFAKLMTQKAHEFGAKNTEFKNPNGLDAPGHYTTAYDLALITRRAMKNEEFSKIVGTKTKKATLINTSADIYFSNHNKMLNIYNGADGVKTGYTRATGRCLVSTAMRNDIRFIAVTLNAPSDWNDHTLMLDFAFSNYENKNIVNEGSILKTVITMDKKELQISAGEKFDMPINKNKEPNCEIVLHLPRTFKSPINKYEKIGVADIVYKKQTIKTIDLISKYEIADDKESIKNDKIFLNCFYKVISRLYT